MKSLSLYSFLFFSLLSVYFFGQENRKCIVESNWLDKLKKSPAGFYWDKTKEFKVGEPVESFKIYAKIPATGKEAKAIPGLTFNLPVVPDNAELISASILNFENIPQGVNYRIEQIPFSANKIVCIEIFGTPSKAGNYTVAAKIKARGKLGFIKAYMYAKYAGFTAKVVN